MVAVSLKKKIFFKQKTAYEMSLCDWSSDVCSSDLTLILPDSWKGRYEVEKDEGESWCRVYARSVLEKNPEWGGALFYVDRSYDRPMTPEELDEISPIACRYLFSTAGGTYSMNYASDVQWNLEDPEQEREYRQMQEEISQIRFLVDGILSD